MENAHAFHVLTWTRSTRRKYLQNGEKRLAHFDHGKPKIDKELAKCKIYCANCHHKYDTIPRMKEGRELLDALLARGAPV